MPAVQRKIPCNRTSTIPFTRPTFVDVQVVDEAGTPLAGERYALELADGERLEGELDHEGRVRREDVLKGVCRFWLYERTRELRLKLESEDGRVFADTPYEVRALGKVYPGRTDAEGRLAVQLPARTRRGTVTFWAALEPDGAPEQQTFDLQL